MLDFPSGPIYGQQFPASNGLLYEWVSPGVWIEVDLASSSLITVVTVAALPAGSTFMLHAVSDSSVAAAGNFGAAVVGGGANNVPVYRDTGGTWRIG